jgi:hypothetical protein
MQILWQLTIGIEAVQQCSYLIQTETVFALKVIASPLMSESVIQTDYRKTPSLPLHFLSTTLSAGRPRMIQNESCTSIYHIWIWSFRGWIVSPPHSL